MDPKIDEMLYARVDEHGNLIKQHGERLNAHAQRIDGLSLVVMGDKNMQIEGLVDRTKALEQLTQEIQQWRRDTMLVSRIAIALLSIVGVGTWIPIVRSLLQLLGG